MFILGLHVPVIPLLEVAGSVKDPPEQIGATCVKAGTTGAETFITTALLVAVNGEAQEALLVITQVTLLPFANVVLV
ncbi:hypothetical protein D3C86_1508240 [compost metagenome]